MDSECHAPFRGQYCFGTLSSWTPRDFIRRDLPDGQILVAHKDLPVEIKGLNDDYIAVIGFCFDYKRPEATLTDTVGRLRPFSAEELLVEVSSLVGRWVLIKSDPHRKLAFSDAGGTFPLIYTMQEQGIVCASSSRLIAAYVDPLTPNPAITPEFRALQATPGRHAGQSFPLRQTDYSDVFANLPNHYLDLSSGCSVRYYFGPADFGRHSSKAVAPKVGLMLTNIMRAISNRYQLAYAATGGYDSRLIASAIARVPGLAEKIDFFTFRYPNDAQGLHNDILLASKVAEKIGGKHRVIEAQSDTPDPASSRLCRQSEEFHATGFEGWMEKAREEVDPQRIILMGWASEIARCFYRWPGCEHVSAEELADCGGVASVPALHGEFAAWLPSAEKAHARTGIPILDLFYWENRVGRWCGGGLNILNTGANWLTLYSCRDLLDLMLSVKEAERGGDRQYFYRQIIHFLAPDIAAIPINPIPMRRRMKSLAVKLVKMTWVKIRRLARG